MFRLSFGGGYNWASSGCAEIEQKKGAFASSAVPLIGEVWDGMPKRMRTLVAGVKGHCPRPGETMGVLNDHQWSIVTSQQRVVRQQVQWFMNRLG